MGSNASAWQGRTTVKSRRFSVASVETSRRSATVIDDAGVDQAQAHVGVRLDQLHAAAVVVQAQLDHLELAAGDQDAESGLLRAAPSWSRPLPLMPAPRVADPRLYRLMLSHILISGGRCSIKPRSGVRGFRVSLL